jgi:hypothetical protein
VIPRTLRAALARHELPAWLREAAALPDGATVESLGPELESSGLERLGHRVELYFLRLLDSNRAAVRGVRVVDRPWPAALDPASVPWPPITWRLRDSAYAADAASLSRVAYCELMAVPRVGARAVLAFAAAAEAALDRAYAGTELPAELVELQRRVAGTAWAARVDAADPRFAGLLQPGTSARSSSAIWQLPEICTRVELIERAPLDVALREYVAALGGVDGDRLEAVLGRLGLDGKPPRSLSKAVNGCSVTPERIRQLQLRALGRRPDRPVYMPALDRALAHLAEIAPCTASDAATSLRARGIVSIPFHPASVLAAAALCRMTTGLVVQPTPRGDLVLGETASARTATIVRLATQRAHRFGAVSVSALVSAVGDLPAEEARMLLVTLADARFLDDDWFWLPRVESRLEALTFRVLAVSGPLEVAAVRAGISRGYRRRDAALVPPGAVLTAFYRTHPSFDVDCRGRVAAARSVDCSAFLGKNDRLFVEIFSQSSTGVLDGASFRDACLTRGMTPHMFAFCKAYSAVLDRPADDLWRLRGTRPAS